MIDDCTLAQKIKGLSSPDNPTTIWLGLTEKTKSLRPYDSLDTIWTMIARTAYTQLNYSPFLLLGTVLGMSLVYLAAPIILLLGIYLKSSNLIIITSLTWFLMAILNKEILVFKPNIFTTIQQIQRVRNELMELLTNQKIGILLLEIALITQ